MIILTVVTTTMLWAADKNGVSPNTVSLPSGPGSIEGMGESFQPMLNTGTARYAVNIALPSGIAGFTPEVTLQYDSGLGDGPLSLGWSFGPGSISRQVDKGLPRYIDENNKLDDDFDNSIDEADEIDTFVGPDGEELVPFDNDIYRARIENKFARYTRTANGWLVELKSGSKLYYGQSTQSRITNSDGTKIYRWLLEKQVSPHGNQIDYTYSRLAGSTNQKYLSEIRYGPSQSPWDVFYFAHFSYEDKSDWRKDYRSGFEIKTKHRLKSIEIGIQGFQPEQCAPGDWNGDETQDALISRYTLEYKNFNSTSSQLSKVTRFGSDGINYLPPITFHYGENAPKETLQQIGSENTPITVMDSELVELVDLNRDGLPDILKTDYYGGIHQVYQNLGMQQLNGSAVIRWDYPKLFNSKDELAAKLHLAEDRVNLADMNGDGISDFVHTTLDKQVRYFPNLGNFSWGAKKDMSVQEKAPPAPFAFEHVTTTDIDFNKHMDVVSSNETGYTVWFNYQDGKYSKPVSTSGATHQGNVLLISDVGFSFADINGDRLNDATRIRPTSIIYSANKGHGLFAPSVEIPIPDTVLTDGTEGQLARAKLSDINGDGLDDLVVERAAANELWYWLNLGTDRLSNKNVVTLPSQLSPNMQVRWADLNGNGTVDLIYADSKSEPRLRTFDIGEYASGSAYPKLLSKIENGLGVTTQINYLSSTQHYLTANAAENPWTSTIPFPTQVVSEVITSAGLDLDFTVGVDFYRKEYVYRDGFYEDRERQFRGFGQVNVIEHGDVTAPTKESINSFFTGGPDGIDNDLDDIIDEINSENHREEEALKGKVRSLEVRSQTDILFSRVENNWLVRNLKTNTNGTEVRFAYNTKTDNKIYEGITEPQILRTTFVYDDYGNITEQKNQGALSITGDEVFTVNEYINNTSRWLLGYPWHQTITDGNDAKVAETFSYYDGPDYIGLPQGEISLGNLTRQKGWLRDEEYIDLARNAFNDYGNIVSILDPNGNQRTVIYENVLHSYPTQEIIEVGNNNPDLSITVAYNLGLGVVTSSLDFNGNQTTYAYDVFSRLTSLVQPGDNVALPTTSYVYTASDPSKELVYHYDQSGTLRLESGITTPSSVTTKAREVSGLTGTFDTIQLVDGLGRKLATIVEEENYYNANDVVVFNAQGTPYYIYQPFTISQPKYWRNFQVIPHSIMNYDAMGRVLSVNNPVDNQGEITVNYTQYLPLQQKTTNENGNKKSLFYDGLERLIEVHEHVHRDTYVTQYAYDPVGNLKSITDAQNNIKSMAYDGLSRRTELLDPNRGQMSYVYDNASNLIRSIDNKNQNIVYSYDGANRLISEDFLDGNNINPDVLYYYDKPSPDYPNARNTNGTMSWVKDLSGASYFSFDDRGNMEWSVKRLIDQGYSHDFLSQSNYDALGRVTRLTYPDGDTIDYTYNKSSQLESIPGFVDDIRYSAAGMFRHIAYANNIKTVFVYGGRNRLVNIRTDNLNIVNDPIQNISFDYDGVSNIKEIVENRNINRTIPESAQQRFFYDDLNRLTQVRGLGFGNIDYEYDKIGNLVFKSSPISNGKKADVNFIDDSLVNLGDINNGGNLGATNRDVRLPGDPPGPHATTSTESGLFFEYDDNGNMTNSNGDSYTWDFKDRLLKTATTSGNDGEYVYDYSGQRVIKHTRLQNGSLSFTYYPTEAYELRNGKTTKYVFAGGRRIARIEGRLTQAGENSTQTLQFNSGWNYFSLTVEPDNPAVSNVLATIQGNYSELLAYDPVTQQYITGVTELHSGLAYIIHVDSPAIVNVSGLYTPGPVNMLNGWNLVPAPVVSTHTTQLAVQSIASNIDSVWGFNSDNQGWFSYLPSELPFLSNLPTLDENKSYWVKTNSDAQWQPVTQTNKIYFYHPDHLGSSSLVTDVNGNVVERTEFYPYGRVRYEERTEFNSAYKYTDKELDKVSGLQYNEARYYNNVIGQFISVDPLSETDERFGDPQRWNSFAYGRGNPLVFTDPSGEAAKISESLMDHPAFKGAWALIYSTKAGRSTINRLRKKEKVLLIDENREVDFKNDNGKIAHWNKATYDIEIFSSKLSILITSDQLAELSKLTGKKEKFIRDGVEYPVVDLGIFRAGFDDSSLLAAFIHHELRHALCDEKDPCHDRIDKLQSEGKQSELVWKSSDPIHNKFLKQLKTIVNPAVDTNKTIKRYDKILEKADHLKDDGSFGE